MENLDSFYYNLLHLKNDKNGVQTIISEVNRACDYMKNNHIIEEGMCKVFSNLIYNNLKDVGISCTLLNTYDLFECYEHEFVLADVMVEDSIQYVLIDMTYEQFLPKENAHLSKSFKVYPAEILKENHMLKELLEQGYSIINEEDFSLYLYSIHQDKEKLNQIHFKDIMYKTYPHR